MLVSDTCGIVSVGIVYISYVLFGYLGISLEMFVISEYFSIESLVFGLFSALSISSHLAAMFIDPGTIKSENTSLMQEGIPCGVCDCIKPPRAHHCITCGKCILNMDHHCPWINNCVGFRNQKHFILFLTYTFIICTWFLIKLVYMLLSQQLQSTPIQNILIMVLGFFGFFYICIIFVTLQEQVRVIVTNISQIDVLQLRKFKQVLDIQRTIYVNLKEIFGGGFGIQWFLPTRISGSPTEIEVIQDIFCDLVPRHN